MRMDFSTQMADALVDRLVEMGLVLIDREVGDAARAVAAAAPGSPEEADAAGELRDAWRRGDERFRKRTSEVADE